MIADSTHSPRRGERALQGEGLRARIAPRLAAIIDDWISAQPDPKPSRSQAIRRLVSLGLAASGFEAPSGETGLEERISRIQHRLATPAPSGPPSPEKGMAMLKRGLAENKLRGLKQRRGAKPSIGSKKV
jgi:hypothetical protein